MSEYWRIVKPGYAFWSGVVAFTANMIALLGIDRLSITHVDLQANFLGALAVSVPVALLVYAKEKVSEYKKVNGHGNDASPAA